MSDLQGTAEEVNVAGTVEVPEVRLAESTGKPRACPRCWGAMTIPHPCDPWMCYDEECKWMDFTDSRTRGDWPFQSA